MQVHVAVQDGNMDEQHEQETRTQALRWWLRKVKRSEICRRLARSRSWLKKWIKRFNLYGWAGVTSESRAPKTHPYAIDAQTADEIVRTRRWLERRTIGLVGGKYIRREMERDETLEHLPSRAEVYRRMGVPIGRAHD